MNTTTRGRYAAPKPRNPFYLLAALATGLLLLAGACSVEEPVTADNFSTERVAVDDAAEQAQEDADRINAEQPKPEPVTAPEPEETEEPTEPEPEPEPAEPEATVGEANAVQAALDYLSFMGFSKSGLANQLEFEGYTKAEIDYALENITVDWKAEAVESAESYLEFSSFSRSGLIDQLLYEGFTQAQAEHAVNEVGL